METFIYLYIFFKLENSWFSHGFFEAEILIFLVRTWESINTHQMMFTKHVVIAIYTLFGIFHSTLFFRNTIWYTPIYSANKFYKLHTFTLLAKYMRKPKVASQIISLHSIVKLIHLLTVLASISKLNSL